MFTRESASRGAGSPRVVGFYDKPSGSIQYLMIDEGTKQAALIDIVQDFDPRHAAAAHQSAQEILDFVRAEGLTLAWILDTHPHADHLMAAAWLKGQTGAPMGIGAEVREIAKLWADIYNTPDAFDPNRDFDRLFEDGDSFTVGDIEVRVKLSPGHTLGSISYIAGDAAFVHDTFMHVDVGTARADFPGGSADVLYDTLQDLLALPDETRLFVGHDYGGPGRDDPAWESTVAEQRANNPHVGGGRPRGDYVKLREDRDATLSLPDRMLHALQVNLRGGRLPAPEGDGHSYFKIPANKF